MAALSILPNLPCDPIGSSQANLSNIPRSSCPSTKPNGTESGPATSRIGRTTRNAGFRAAWPRRFNGDEEVSVTRLAVLCSNPDASLTKSRPNGMQMTPQMMTAQAQGHPQQVSTFLHMHHSRDVDDLSPPAPGRRPRHVSTKRQTDASQLWQCGCEPVWRATRDSSSTANAAPRQFTVQSSHGGANTKPKHGPSLVARSAARATDAATADDAGPHGSQPAITATHTAVRSWSE